MSLFCTKFGRKRQVAPAFWMGVFMVGFALSSQQGRIEKRIVNGFVLNSVYSLDTYHFVHIRQAWGCISEQSIHALQDCLEEALCGGTLFHPEFVLTAAHCVFYKEFYLRNISRIYDAFAAAQEGQGQGIDGGVTVLARLVQSAHEFYSNVVLLAGSTNFFRMKQKRHAHKVFSYPGYYGYEKQRNQNYLAHDVALVQACEPFEITSHVKVAPMMPLQDLPAQYESIIQRSATCLYVGFGETRDKSNERRTVRGNFVIPTEFMRYTWRQTACAARCNFNKTRGYNQPKNPCFLCSDHLHPRVGTPDTGDSGGPVVCDGYFVAVAHARYIDLAVNESMVWAFPLHCIRYAISPVRLEYYKKVSPRGKEFHPLDPVSGPVLEQEGKNKKNINFVERTHRLVFD